MEGEAFNMVELCTGSNPYMGAAISSAMAGITNGDGGPYGACVVREGSIIAVAHNTVLKCSDPTNHAEMECIRQAGKVLQSHDLSDCELYTTCEFCPMCLGCVRLSGIKKVYVGVRRHTAAEFGFDDAAFYKEIAIPFVMRPRAGTRGVMAKEIEEELLYKSLTYKRRQCSGDGDLGAVYKTFLDESEDKWTQPNGCKTSERFMEAAVAASANGMENGNSKEREPFGAAVVLNNEIIATAYDTVLKQRDPTCTAGINAIRKACSILHTHDLSDCEIFVTVEPDLMTYGAICWSRIRRVHAGVSLRCAAAYGFKEGLLEYMDLNESGSRSIDIEWGVMTAQCTEVFIMWKSLKGKIY